MRNSTNREDSSLAEKAGNAFLWRVIGLGAEKAVFLLRIIFLARLVPPEAFGLVAIGMTANALLSRLTDFGLVQALIQNPAVEKAQLDTAWTINVLRGFGITVTLFVAAPWIAELFSEPDATNIIRALALVSLAQSAASIQIARVTRDLEFRSLVSVRLLAGIVNTVIALWLARSLGAWALVWGTVSGAATYAFASFLVAPYRPAFRLTAAAMDRVMRFGRWIFLIGILGVVGDGLIRWLISARLGVTELGLFFLAARLAYLPFQLITDLINQVAFPVYSRLQSERPKLARVFRSMLGSLLILLIPISAVFVVLIPGLVEHVLGEKWIGATQVMQALVIASVLGAVGDAAEPLLKGIARPEKIAALDSIRLVVLVVIAWLLLDSLGLVGIGVAEIGAALLTHAAVILALRDSGIRPMRGLFPLTIAVCVAAASGGLVTLAITSYMPGIIGLIAGGVIGALVAAVIGLALDRALALGVMRRLAEPFPRVAEFIRRRRERA